MSSMNLRMTGMTLPSDVTMIRFLTILPSLSTSCVLKTVILWSSNVTSHFFEVMKDSLPVCMDLDSTASPPLGVGTLYVMYHIMIL